MRLIMYGFCLFLLAPTLAQKSKLEILGCRHLQTTYKGDSVDILMKSKTGEELKRKPVFLFCQGSLPQPLIKTEGEKTYGVFPFKTDSLEVDYHIVIIGKPYIPILADVKNLGINFMYLDPETGSIPKKYSKRNLLDYYVYRNLKIIQYLQKLAYVDNSKLVLAGHSQGSTVAAKIASKSKKITHLIYSGGNPLGQIMAMIGQGRSTETDTDSTRYGEQEFDYWEEVVNNKAGMSDMHGDTYKSTYDFSIPPIEYLEKLTIPVLITYGTKDWSAQSNDYLRVEMLRKNKKNFTYRAYIGLEHNYFPLTIIGQPDYNIFNWNKVANDWWNWIKQNRSSLN